MVMVQRMGIEFEGTVNKDFRRIFRQKGEGHKQNEVWYLQTVCTDPEEQGKGSQ